MIPTMLTRSLNRWRYWLDGSTSKTVLRRRRLHYRPAAFFRPQLLALEERCLLSTTSTPLLEAFPIHRAASGISTAQFLDNVTTSPVSQTPGTQVIVIVAEALPAKPICVEGTLYQSAEPGDYTLVVTIVPTQSDGTPTIEPPSHDFIVIFATTTTTAIEPGSILVASMSQNPTQSPVLIMASRPDCDTSANIGNLVYIGMSAGGYTVNIETQVHMPENPPASPTPPPPLSPPLNPSVPPVPQPPIRPIPGVPTGSPPEQNRGTSWRSQTPHPSQSTVVVLVVPYGTLSIVPAARASTPVYLFSSSQVTFATHEAVPEVSSSFMLPSLVERMVALELTAFLASGQAEGNEIGVEGLCVLPAVALEPPPTFMEDPTESESENVDESTGKAKPAPTRAQLLAMTDRILQESSQKVDEAESSAGVFSFHTVIVCAAVQSVWLGLRQLATRRVQETRSDGGEPYTWSWKRSK
jgi:hypothetical protein